MNQLKNLLRQVAPWLMVALLTVSFYELLEHLSWVYSVFHAAFAILLPFLVGIALAWLLDIPTRKIEERYIKNRALSVFAVLIGVLLLFWLLIAMVVPQLRVSLDGFIKSVPHYIENLQAQLGQLPIATPIDEDAIETLFSDWKSLTEELLAFLGSYSENLFAYGKAIGNGLVAALTAIVSAIYILLEKEHLMRQLKKVCRALLPKQICGWLLRIYQLSDRMLSGFLMGKLLDSLVIGILTAIAMSLLRIPFIALISVLVGVTNIVPVVGPIIGGAIGGVILLLAAPERLLVYIILILVIQQLDGHLIGPKILGNTVGLSTAWTLFAIIVGGELFGFMGMILGVPVFAVIYTLTGEFVHHQLEKKEGTWEGTP